MPEEFEVLLCQIDFQQKGADRFFLSSRDQLVEVSAEEVVSKDAVLVCHDYWLIAPALYRTTSKIPPRVVDLDDFAFLIDGKRLDKRQREQRGFLKSITDLCPPATLKAYAEMHAGRQAVDLQIFGELAVATTIQWARLCLEAGYCGELKRCLELEFPILNYLMLCMMTGISIDTEKLREHRKTIEHDYYTTLKDFAIRYDLPFEVPSNESAIRYLEENGFDFTDVPLSYVVELLPTSNDFGSSLSELRKISDSRGVLWSLSFGANKVQPIVDVFGSRTSRIYLRAPALQGLAKRHRDIIIPTSGYRLAYVDYGQFEVGVMAALSGDNELQTLFAFDDLYTEVARRLYGENSEITSKQRKFAKKLFLSYAYGMSIKGLLDATNAQGIDRVRAKLFFRSFSRYEEWKKEIHTRFAQHGRIGTSEGNFMTRESKEPITAKEGRSAVSQVVQGTASLIFKKALLKIKDITAINVKLPMHDAILFECRAEFDIGIVVKTMEDAMTENLLGIVRGKASEEKYFAAL